MNKDEMKAHMTGKSESPSLAQSKVGYLEERGYRQVAVVMARDSGDCAVVSNLGRVTWHGEAFRGYVQGGSQTHSTGAASDA